MVDSKVTHSFFFLGNHPALDFLNTSPHEHGVPVDRLTDFRALLAWLEQAGLVLPEDIARAEAQWGGTLEGEAVVVRARAVRELYRRVILQIADGHALDTELLVQLNVALREESGAYTELRRLRRATFNAERVRDARDEAQERLTRITRLALRAPEDVLAPILRSMSALLAEANLAYVRACEDAECVLVFYDVSKNHARRWCSMDACGNRNKVNAYRARR